MANISVSLYWRDVAENLRDQWNSNDMSNWGPWENVVKTHLQQKLGYAQISSVEMDMQPATNPGPVVMRFTVDSTNAITADALKTALKTP